MVKKYVRIGEGSIIYSIGHHRFIEMARAAGAVYKINEGQGGTVLINLEIFAEDGDSLYKSKKIAPGYEMSVIELDKALPEGRHECTIRIQNATSGTVASGFPIILEVK